MLTPPQQDWSFYEAVTRPHEAKWLRSLTPEQSFQIYADLYQFIFEARRRRRDWSKLETWHWQQKLETRQRMVEAFRQLDQIRHDRRTAHDAG
jgi:hypothetical protein